jgi:hypothetical protein
MPDKKLKSTGITLDGTPIALRPLLPEDEPALGVPVNYSIGGGVKPPNSRSIIPANAIVVWSFR